MKTYICSSRHPMSKRVTLGIAKSMRPKYKGWRTRHDAKYVPLMLFAFVLSPTGDRILAALRVAIKRGTDSRPFPMEDAAPQTRIPEIDEWVAEVTGITCEDHEALEILIQDVGQLLLDMGVQFVFALYNPKDPATSKLLVNDLEFERLPQIAARYSGFTDKRTGSDAVWEKLRYTRQQLKDLGKKLRKRGVRASQPVVDLDLIA
ncbi:MAG TPA: hypothetical protein VE093_48155 [Polyangiaceae bacterium]|nr:hypothetical protein [Polyangiaceae bacterium]